MATTIHEPPQIDPRRSPDEGHSGNGGWRNLVPADGDLRVALDYSPPPSSTGIWVVLFAITMMFAAFTSALIVRKGSSLDWRTFTLPSILYLNTLLLLASSVTLEVTRRRVTTFMGGLKSQVESPARWLYITLFLGLLFVAGSVCCVVAVESGGAVSRHQSKQFFFLFADGCTCAARAGRSGRADLCHPQAE
jgi:cytochrome c oxidase subunit 3